jgi:hypothetical protein
VDDNFQKVSKKVKNFAESAIWLQKQRKIPQEYKIETTECSREQGTLRYVSPDGQIGWEYRSLENRRISTQFLLFHHLLAYMLPLLLPDGPAR